MVKRIARLDGLRGLACLQVVIGHYAQTYLPYDNQRLGILGNPANAVAVFFLISGFVLTASFDVPDWRPLARGGGRVVRLFAPAYISAVRAGLLTVFGHVHAGLAEYACGWPWPKAGALAGLPEDLSGVPIFFGYREKSLFDWTWLPSEDFSVNVPLWTMSVEIWGSFWILALCWLRRRGRAFYAASLLAAVPIFAISQLCLFTIGHLCAAASRHLSLRAMPRMHLAAVAGAALIGGGILWNSGFALNLGGIFGCLPQGALRPTSLMMLEIELGSSAIFCGVLLSRAAQNLLSARVPQYLGRLSFAIYLLRFPVMDQVASTVFLAALPLGHFAAASVCFAAGLAMTIGLASWFERYVDRPVTRLSRAVRFAGRQAVSA